MIKDGQLVGQLNYYQIEKIQKIFMGRKLNQITIIKDLN